MVSMLCLSCAIVASPICYEGLSIRRFTFGTEMVWVNVATLGSESAGEMSQLFTWEMKPQWGGGN